MPNQFVVSPFRIDTTSAAILFQRDIKVQWMEYVGYAASSHRVEVQDKYGHIIAVLQGMPTLEVISTPKAIGLVRGLKVPQTDSDGNANMQSGKVLVYYA